MQTVSLREIQHNAASVFSKVRQGQSFLVTRHKQTIAVLSPVTEEAKHPGRGSTQGIYHGTNMADPNWDGIKSPLSTDEIKALGNRLP